MYWFLSFHPKFSFFCVFRPTKQQKLHFHPLPLFFPSLSLQPNTALGNLLGLIILSWFRRHGHTTVALIGGATGRVGDPSGKSLERPELDAKALENNSRAIKQLISKILGNSDGAIAKDATLGEGSEKSSILTADASSSVVILDNYDWWKGITLLDFLKEVGRFARVGTMMAKDSVKKRLNSEEGMSYTEFTYQLLQGYDFVYLFKNHGVNVQIGGSDQWGNITAGTELIRKIMQAEGACWVLAFKPNSIFDDEHTIMLLLMSSMV